MIPIKVKFWGTRGSIPVPGKTTIRYGGNTSCVEIRHGENIFICDSGTGIRELGMSLLGEFRASPIKAEIFVGHTHWDHIQGFPFFVPAYLARNSFRVHSVSSVGDSFENILRRQMGQNYFPVEVGDMQAHLDFAHAGREFEVGGVKIRTTFTNHPGVNIAYRFHFDGGRSVIYMTDHENHLAFGGKNDLTVREDNQIREFCTGTDLLICDAQYTEKDYELKRGWGHSRWRDTLELALAAGVGTLALFHHEPLRSDDDLDAIVRECGALIAKSGKPLACFAAAEGQTFEL